MDGDKLRVALVSCAGVGMRHVPCWRLLEDQGKAKITTVMDVDSDVAEVVARVAGGVPWTTDLDEVLARDDVDAVDICSPPFAHAEQVVKAAEAGKHVLLEKPITVNLDDADRVIAACKEAGVKLALAFSRPLSSQGRRLKEMIETEELGKPIRIYVTHHMRTEWLRKPSNWFWDPSKSGGTAIEGVIHDFQYLPWLMGPAKRIYAEAGTFIYSDREPTLPDDQLVVLWRFESGAIGIIDAGANKPSNFPREGSIFFTEGAVRFGRDNPVRIYRGVTEYDPAVEELHDLSPAGDNIRRTPSAFRPDSHMLEIEHFVDCVLNDKKPVTSGEEGRYALECAWAAIKSFQTNQPVTLPLERPYPRY